MITVDNTDITIFEKVSFKEYEKDMIHFYPDLKRYTETDKEYLWRLWNAIKIPARSTTGAAGYDFFAPFEFVLSQGEQIVIPTGIRAKFLKEGWYLMMMPRSSAVKTRVELINTLGLIDSDYHFAKNEGHIIIFLEIPVLGSSLIQQPIHSKFGKLLLPEPKTLEVSAGISFCQGVLNIYGLKKYDEDDIKEDRTGGFGSTDKGEEIPIPDDEDIKEEPSEDNKDEGISIPIPDDEVLENETDKKDEEESTECKCGFDKTVCCKCPWRNHEKEETDEGGSMEIPKDEDLTDETEKPDDEKEWVEDKGESIPIPDDEELIDETEKKDEEEGTGEGEIEIPKDEDLKDETPPERDYLDYDEEGTNCGTRIGTMVQLTKENIEKWYFRYIITENGVERLLPENEEKYLNKSVVFRTPSFCLGKKICSVCAGIIPSNEEIEAKPPSDLEIVEDEKGEEKNNA